MIMIACNNMNNLPYKYLTINTNNASVDLYNVSLNFNHFKSEIGGKSMSSAVSIMM